MESQFVDLESLRSQLRGMKRKDLLSLADEAAVSRSTAEKIRHGHIANPAYDKVAALASALRRRDVAAQLCTFAERTAIGAGEEVAHA